MLCFLNVGHVTVGAVTLDVFPPPRFQMEKKLGLGSLWVLIVCSYTSTNWSRGKKNLNQVSRENVVVNKGKLSLNNQKYRFNLQKYLQRLHKEKILEHWCKEYFRVFQGAFDISKRKKHSSRIWHHQLSTWTTRASTIWCISLFHDWLSRFVFFLTHRT